MLHYSLRVNYTPCVVLPLLRLYTEETRVVQLAIRKFVSCSWRIFAGVEGAVQTRDEQQVVPALRQLSRNFRNQLGNLTGTALVAQVQILFKVCKL